MATAIPPRAAEVANNRPVRQKFLCSRRMGRLVLDQHRTAEHLRKVHNDLR